MIYDYDCVSCGNHFHGSDILFDMNELLGIRDGSKDGMPKNMLTMVAWKQILAWAKNAQVAVPNGKVTRIPLSLKNYLRIIGYNHQCMGQGGIGVNDMEDVGYNDLNDIFADLIGSNGNAINVELETKQLVSSIGHCFKYTGTGDREDTKNYKAYLFIKPIYFENSQEIYTLEYKFKNEQANPYRPHLQKEIRGYCPKCGKPILMGSGLYPQIKIGLLGAQSSGKTTLILSLLSVLQVPEVYQKLKIKCPSDILCDARYDDFQKNWELFKEGWSPQKTSAEGENVFNASIMIESVVQHKTVILTFVDIAGEQCWDPDKQAVNINDALQRFPMINHCDLYLLCSCLDRTQYGNADGNVDGKMLAPEAVLRIAKGIYKALSNPHKKPPLCIVLTKSDMTSADANIKKADEETPFKAIHLRPQYQFQSQFNNLETTYKMLSTPNTRLQRDWCVATYNDMKQTTYISMMSCSALGREGELCAVSDQIPTNPKGAFQPVHVEDLLTWIFEAAGITPVTAKGECFKTVPSYGERYTDSAELMKCGIYPAKDAVERSRLIPYVFMNLSEDDEQISRIGSDQRLKRNGGGVHLFKTKNPLATFLTSKGLLV